MDVHAERQEIVEFGKRLHREGDRRERQSPEEVGHGPPSRESVGRCRVRGRADGSRCDFRDGLTPLLEKITEADILILGSPFYFGTSGSLCSYDTLQSKDYAKYQASR